MLRKLAIVAIFLLSAFLIMKFAWNDSTKGAPEAPKPVPQHDNSKNEITNAVAAINSQMPMTVLDGALRIERAAMEGGTLNLYAHQVNRPDDQNSDKDRFQAYARESYCKNQLHSFAVARIPVQFNFQSPPRGLDDLSVDTWTVSLNPADCG